MGVQKHGYCAAATMIHQPWCDHKFFTKNTAWKHSFTTSREHLPPFHMLLCTFTLSFATSRQYRVAATTHRLTGNWWWRERKKAAEKKAEVYSINSYQRRSLWTQKCTSDWKLCKQILLLRINQVFKCNKKKSLKISKLTHIQTQNF